MTYPDAERCVVLVRGARHAVAAIAAPEPVPLEQKA